jgi:hypothetical protein
MKGITLTMMMMMMIINYNKSILCEQYGNSIAHIISACPSMVEDQYMKMHVRVCAELLFNVCKGNRGKIKQ